MAMTTHIPLRKWRGIRPYKRHSLVLMVAGLVYVLIGTSYITTEPTPSRLLGLVLAYKWMSPEAWGLFFILAGTLSIISSRWPPMSETWGYTVLTGLSAGWSAFYLLGIVFFDAPASGSSAVMSWGLIAFLWWAISGLLNPDGTPHSDRFRYEGPRPLPGVTDGRGGWARRLQSSLASWLRSLAPALRGRHKERRPKPPL